MRILRSLFPARSLAAVRGPTRVKLDATVASVGEATAPGDTASMDYRSTGPDIYVPGDELIIEDRPT